VVRSIRKGGQRRDVLQAGIPVRAKEKVGFPVQKWRVSGPGGEDWDVTAKKKTRTVDHGALRFLACR